MQKIRAMPAFFADVKVHVFAVLLFVSTFLWMAIYNNRGPDKMIQRWSAGIRHMVLPDPLKPAPEEIIFIDVSKSRYLIPLDEDEDSFENEVIVNRQYLTQLFNLITDNNIQVEYIFCDVFFGIPTPDDDLLIQSIEGLKDKILCIDTYAGSSPNVKLWSVTEFVAWMFGGNSLNKNLLGVRSATASLNLHRGIVYKIPFFGPFGDMMVPFKRYTDMEKVEYRKNFLFTWFSGKGISFNYQINDHPLRKYHFTEEYYEKKDEKYAKIGLGELLSYWEFAPEVVGQLLQNRFVLIGDFETDTHNTTIDRQPGTLITFNAFRHLLLDRHILSVWYLVTLYIFLYCIVWLWAGKKSRHLKITIKIKYFEPFVFPVNIFSVSLLLIIFSYISSLLFGVNISIFHLIFIFSWVDLIKFIWNKRIKTTKPTDDKTVRLVN